MRILLRFPTGKTVTISEGVTTIGRDSGNDIVVTDDRRVSRQHAEFDWQNEHIILRDRGSRNGTFVNGNKIVECELADGDVIRLGTTELKIAVRDVAVKPAPEAPVPVESYCPRCKHNRECASQGTTRELLRQARLALQENDADRAIRELLTIIRSEPQCVEAHALLGTLYAQRGLREQATKAFEAATHLCEDDPSLRFDYALALMNQGDSEGAAKEAETILRSHPGHTKALSLLNLLSSAPAPARVPVAPSPKQPPVAPEGGPITPMLVGMVPCPTCGEMNSRRKAFCYVCGSPLAILGLCPKCGKVPIAKDNPEVLCRSCGANLLPYARRRVIIERLDNGTQVLMCSSCGSTKLSPEDVSCAHCGLDFMGMPEYSQTSGLALASLVLGILGLFTAGLTAIVGLVLGLIGLRQAREIEGAPAATGMATATAGVAASISILLLNLIAGIIIQSMVAKQANLRSQMCQRNLKQIGLALAVYRADWNDMNPVPSVRSGGWVGTLQPYIRNSRVFLCPAAEMYQTTGYDMNRELFGLKDRRIGNAGALVTAWDSNSDFMNAASVCENTDLRHSRGLNVLYYDGHVRWERPQGRLLGCTVMPPPGYFE